MCSDQLLLALADPAEIAGLSPYARDPVRSFYATEAARYPLLSGGAEDLLVLKPDIVLAGRFTKRATREFLKQHGFRLVEFDAAHDLTEAKDHIRQVGTLLHHEDRAAAAVATIDAAVTRARAAALRHPLRVLAIARRGWVSGGNTLMSSLLAEVGLTNAAQTLGYRSGGFAPLETIVALKPDLIVMSENTDFAEDQGKAFLMHPALERLFPADRRLVLPERLTICPGPMLADAIDRLTSEIEHLQ